MGLTDEIATEIRPLRKGRGLQASDLDSRLGPLLRELARRPDAGDAASRRQALLAELTRCAARLPEDLRIAVMASMGLSPATRQMPHLGDRVAWLAAQIERDNRTALRRVDAAERLLAEEIASELRRRRNRNATVPDGWYLDEFRTLLRLDSEQIESLEHRRIVSTQDGLREVMAWLDVPGETGQPELDLQADMMYGGNLIRRMKSSKRFQLVVRLPKPLQPGEEHEYGLILRMPKHMLLSPHYILTPECQCNSFDLRVRFDLDHLPVWVRRVDGETVRTFERAEPSEKLVTPDDAGEVHQEFRDLTMYLGYGVQWRPAP